MAWDEDALHRWIAAKLAPRGLAGSPGHDAAVLKALQPVGTARPVVCTDQVVAGVHFEPATAPGRVGRKAVDRTLSDLAATAARPRGVLLALRAPPSVSAGWIRAVLRGAAARAEAFGAELVGGDLCAAPGPAGLSVMALGELEGGRRPPGRDRARAGQRLFLTGPTGGSRRGRQLAIEPRIEAGRRLWHAGATALMDVSDGLAFDLFRLARAAGVRLEVDLALVPIHADAHRAARTSGRTALDHALHDGEDHELIASGPRGLGRLAGGVGRAAWAAVEIGRVTAGSGLALLDRRGDGDRVRTWRPEEGGWKHGAV